MRLLRACTLAMTEKKNLAFALTLIWLGCNTVPVGSDLIGRVPEQRTIELLPDTVDSYAKFIPLGFADYLVLGKDDQYESRVLFKFELKDSAVDEVASVQLLVYPREDYSLKFRCYPCSTNWSTAGVTWRMADSLNQWVNPGGDYFNTLLGEGTITKDSTLVELNRDYLSLLLQKPYGIVLISADTGFATLTPLTNAESAPRLVLTYQNGKKRTYPAVEDAHIVDSLAIGTNPNELLVGSSVAFRTYLHFSLDSVPAAATIAGAELEFKPQPIYSRAETIWIGVHRLVDSYLGKGKYAQFDPTPAGKSFYFPSGNDTIVRLTINELIQNWVSHPDSNPNYGVLLTAEPEWLKPFRIKIFRSGPWAPRLRISYIMPPEDRFSR